MLSEICMWVSNQGKKTSLCGLRWMIYAYMWIWMISIRLYGECKPMLQLRMWIR